MKIYLGLIIKDLERKLLEQCHVFHSPKASNLDIHEENSLLLYNPQRELPIDLQVEPNSWIVSVLISIKRFHGLFSQEADYITFLSEDNRDKKYYKHGIISPSMAIRGSRR